MIVGNPSAQVIVRIRENFVTLDIDPSIKIETINKLKSNMTKPLYQNIVKEHIVVMGTQNHIKFLDEINR